MMDKLNPEDFQVLNRDVAERGRDAILPRYLAGEFDDDLEDDDE